MIDTVTNGIKNIGGFWKKRGYITIVIISIILILVFSGFSLISGKKGSHEKNPQKIWNSISYSTPYSGKKKSNEYYNSHVENGSSNDSLGEKECRRVLQKIFKGKPFIKIRPDFLRNPVTSGNHNLELDCYNAELRLACEYNGQQHYEYNSYFHRNRDHFQTQKYRDEMKKRICRDMGINFIEVPYTVKLQNIENYLVRSCEKLGYNVDHTIL